MAFAELKGIKTYYEIHGTGLPLVLIAGYTCDHFFWTSMIDQLACHFQVLVFDNRAIGQTIDNKKAFSLEVMAEDVINLIEYLNWDKPSIVGQSMGGLIAQQIAARFPDKLNKLVILNSMEKLNPLAEMALENILNLRKANISFDLLIETALPWVCSGSYLAKKEHIRVFKEAVKNNPAPQSIDDQERQFSVLKACDSRPWNKTIQCPSLVVTATEDIISPICEAEQLADHLKAKFLKIPGGHASPLEQPEKLSQILLEFLLS
jgi:pimeloyl-ACP methyl ester carboxylesterase